MSTTAASFLIVDGTKESRQTILESHLSKFGFSKNSLSEAGLDKIELILEKDSIGIEKTRDFQKLLSIRPVAHPIKVGIIHDAESLTIEAQNSLLKFLEEPPDNVFIFLSASNDHSLLPTVISRCQIISAPASKMEISSEDFQKMSNWLETLSSASLPVRLNMVQQITASRDSAIKWLDQVLIFIHSKILSLKPDSKLTDQFRRIFEAKKHLKANSNVRLTMENLFINW